MEIIAICNQKGGCAKTTTAVNLAASFADLGRKVLLIDNDPQGNLTQSIGVNGYKNTILQCLINNISIQEAAIDSSFENISIVSADINYANAELALANVNNNEFLLKDAFKRSELNYDYVLIDCSPSLSLTTLNALVAADSILIPLEPSIFNLLGLAQLINILKLVIANFNKELKVKGVLLTRVDTRSNLAIQFESQLKEVFGDTLFKTMIHQNISVARSQIEKKPIIHYDRWNKVSREYLALAKEIIERD
jgi:chromosome partitioning protein